MTGRKYFGVFPISDQTPLQCIQPVNLIRLTTPFYYLTNSRLIAVQPIGRVKLILVAGRAPANFFGEATFSDDDDVFKTSQFGTEYNKTLDELQPPYPPRSSR